jgi:23S rRNA pseudouridine1911/1915/1917 synthase
LTVPSNQTPPSRHDEPSDSGRRFVVGAADSGVRLDKFLATSLPEYSRSRLQRWIESGDVTCNGKVQRARDAVYVGDVVVVVEQALPDAGAYLPQAMPLDIVFEDPHILVINKPAGLVVHPGAGNWQGTLLNGLLAYDPSLAQVPRAGIVHRLDAGTSGLLVVARTPQAHADLVRQLAQRTVAREYWAIVAGAVAPSLTIDSAIARDPRNPLRFCVSRNARAREARTFVRCLQTWPFPKKPANPDALTARVSWVACRLDTGRTHQIRVHMESQGHPLIGDPVYRRHLPAVLVETSLLARPALHACRLELMHPASHEWMGWSVTPPEDFTALLKKLGARPTQWRAPQAMSVVIHKPDDMQSIDADSDDDFDDDDF